MNRFAPQGNSIFAKMVRAEIPVRKILEDEFSFSIFDIRPRDKTHILLIPKYEFKDLTEFLELADPSLVHNIMQGINNTVKFLGLPHYRLATNVGEGSGQEVFYLHFHILSDFALSKV